MPKVRVALGSTWLATFLSLHLMDCWVTRTHVDTIDCSELTRTFFRKPIQAQMKEFGDRSLDEQYAIFICGNQIIHPPAMYLSQPFADQGPRIVEFLRMKLIQAEGDLTIRDIIRVFVEMSRQGTYDVAQDPSLMTLMTESAARIKDVERRRFTYRILSEVRR